MHEEVDNDHTLPDAQNLTWNELETNNFLILQAPGEKLRRTSGRIVAAGQVVRVPGGHVLL